MSEVIIKDMKWYSSKYMKWHSSKSEQVAKAVSFDIIKYEEALPIPTIIAEADNKGSFDLSDQSVNGWIALIKQELYSVSLVEDIFIGIEDSDVDVWVVIPERDIAALTQLSNIEWELLKMFVSGEHPVFLIDFHIVYRCGRNAEDLVPTRTIRLPRQV